MLINRDGLIWVGNRIQEVDTGSALTWQMPQGGIDDGESAGEAAMRELLEETGTAKARIIGETSDWLTYDLPPHLVGVALKGKYRGQKQKWFAMRFTGRDGDIDIAADVHQEFSEWTWVPVDELVELIVPFKRGVYERIVRELGPLAVPGE
ncbi:MAG: RNA pyrophosphohydrolase [Alphaproteobacteria bacterium HGW-Alphaproteobacteria-12]|nr:MAG: RNA pyrophosphohydrolase [Alphaproteobacteria bacterium HGW-Alphaproteobacteria-12]